MIDRALRTELTVYTMYPQFRETQQNPTWDDIQLAIQRVAAFGPQFSEDKLNRMSLASRELFSKYLARNGYLEMTSWITKPTIYKCYLRVNTPLPGNEHFRVEAKVQYLYSNIYHRAIGSVEHENEIAPRFSALLQSDPAWHEGLEWKPVLPDIPQPLPGMLLEIIRPAEFFVERYSEPTTDQLITALRDMKYKSEFPSPNARLTYFPVQQETISETIKATKLSSQDFSLLYERRSHEEIVTHQCTLVPLTAKQIIETFLSCLRQENNWKYKLSWLPSFGPNGPKVPRQPHTVNKENDGVVYLLRAGTHYKIGKSIDPQARYETLDIQLPWKPERVHEIATNNIHRLEKHWHRYFADRRANGEWFSLTSDDLEEFCGVEHVDYK